MSANTAPVFIVKANTPSIALAAANTASDGSGTLSLLFTSGANCSRIDFLEIISAQLSPAASTAKDVRFYITDTAGANPHLIREVALPAATRSASAVGTSASVIFTNGLLLAPGQLLYCSMSVYASAVDLTHIVARGGDY